MSIMQLYQDKISTKDIQIGMYVSKLDCSWLDTPFPYQGFFVRSLCEIKELQIFCQFVYIDSKRGCTPYNQSEISKPSPLLTKNKSQLRKSIPANKFRKANVYIGKYYKKQKPFFKEAKRAKGLFTDLNVSIKDLSFNLKSGNKVDFQATKVITQKIVRSVLRNPDTLICLSRLKDKAGYTYDHSLRCCIMAAVFGRYLGLDEQNLLHLTTGVLLADIGKAKINSRLLNLTGTVTTSEKLEFRSHVEKGVEILAKKQEFEHDVLVIAETHHERYNGSGYPYALKGNEIPYFGQIAGIVDVFDAITNKKSYGKVYDTASAMDWIYSQRNVLFSQELVDDFIQAIGLYPAGTKVELTDQSIAVVVSQNQDKRLRPVVILIKDKNNKIIQKSKTIDLSKKSFMSRKQRPMVVRALIG